MKRALIRVDAMVLSQFHPQAVGLLPGYSRTLEIVYTIGKTPEWGLSQRSSVLGKLDEATIRPQTRHLYGKILIDVLSCSTSSTAPSLTIGGGMSTSADVTFDDLRRSVFKTFAHESFHVVQAWLLGGKSVLMVRQWEHVIRNWFLDAEAIYQKNLFEQAAFARDQAVSVRFNPQVDQGRFDYLFALDLLREVRPQLSIQSGSRRDNAKVVEIDSSSTLSGFSKAEYGTFDYWPLIWDLNREAIGANPNRLPRGARIRIAALSAYSPDELADAKRRAPTWKKYSG
jgi:hypothetical protein